MCVCVFVCVAGKGGDHRRARYEDKDKEWGALRVEEENKREGHVLPVKACG